MTKILEVINPEAHFPIVFSFPLTNGATIEDGIRMFETEVYSGKLDSEIFNDILDALKHEDVYWLHELYCFTFAYIKA